LPPKPLMCITHEGLKGVLGDYKSGYILSSFGKRHLSLGDLKWFQREEEANILGISLDGVQWMFTGF
jgi:hypothetical protein